MKRKLSMEVVNPRAAGIDIGSKSHFVSVGQSPNEVREFGVYTHDHDEMISWLQGYGITSVAMESTGDYRRATPWQTLFSALQTAGFEVLLVNGRDVKNVKGKKTDVMDCMWIQQLHSLGLLHGSFLPDEHTRKLQTYTHHRQSLVAQSAKYVLKMQKALRLMNIRLDVAIRDITGKTGTAIINAILAGERDAYHLADLADIRIKKSKEEIAASLQGEWKEDQLFLLQECLEMYEYYRGKIMIVDQQIERLLNIALQEKSTLLPLPSFKKKKTHKNDPYFDLRTIANQIFGVDLYQIDGISHGTVLSIMSTLGNGICKFPSAKHFISWLRLAPNNRISGGKRLSSRTPKGKNQLTLALRQAANAVGNTKNHPLKKFFNRIAYKKGRGAAITATARKLATILYNMIIKKESFNPYNHLQDRYERVKGLLL